MSQQTGENELSWHRILEFIRMASILILVLHFYFVSCPVCGQWQAANPILDRLMNALAATGLFESPVMTKLVVLLLLVVSLLGSRGKKKPEYRFETALANLFCGLFLYFASGLLSDIPLLYFLLCGLGYLLLLQAGIYATRVIWHRPAPDLFNRLHESFPQEERKLMNPHSIHFQGEYLYQDEQRECWVNLTNPFRGTLILGSPGSGKTWYLIEPMIRQYIQKGFAVLAYDFKYDDLSRIVYNSFLLYKDRYPGRAVYYNLHFSDLNRSNRCNPLHPSTLADLQDAGEAARTVLLAMQAHGNDARSDFFLDSAINFVQTLIWFLRSYQNGIYCSWPHVIELAQTPYNRLFTILSAQPQLVTLVTPFINAFKNSPKQLEGQIATAAIVLARLSSPAVYYIMTGNDFTLDLNDPAAPKLLTIGSNPQKADTYGPMIAAYINTINRLANRKGGHPLAEIIDEFSTVRINSILRSITTGRSNKLAITLCVQDASQLRLTYGKDFADVVLNTCGNVISGQTGGDTARLLSERFGKTMQDRESLTSTAADLHITQSHQLEYVIPVSRIASLSAGEFVGMVADTPETPIPVKTFCCRLVNDPAALAAETASFAALPTVRCVTEEMLMAHFELVRSEVQLVVDSEMERIRNSPELAGLEL